MIRFLTLTLMLAWMSMAHAAGPVAAATHAQVLEATADLIAARYVDPERGEALAAQLRADARQDRFAGAADDAAFAEAVKERLRTLSGDGHFDLMLRPQADAASVDEDVLMERWYGVGVNHGFEKVERLRDGIGYLELRVFAPTDKAGDLAAAAMTLLAQSPALIIDLRRNGGGMEEMVRLLAAYLLDDVREMSAAYDRPSDTTTRGFTPAMVAGRRYGGSRPVYILVSKRTFSAAEQFAYDLQAMGRAVVVGEQTGGGAHPSGQHRVGDRFLLTLPEGRSINPITKGDWEGVGVIPDVRTAPDQALEAALERASAALGTLR